MRILILLATLLCTMTANTAAFNVPEVYDVGYKDVSFNMDLLGNGELQAVNLTNNMPYKTMYLYQNGRFISSVRFNFGSGRILVSNFRETNGQDMALSLNDGSGAFIQSVQIIGYNGSTTKISVLLDVKKNISNGCSGGKFVVEDGVLYFDYYIRKPVNGLSNAQFPRTHYRIRVCNDGIRYWLGEPQLM